MHNDIFKDRLEAGLLLSEKLQRYKNTNSVVLAIPRGGVPVAHEVAKSLDLPLDIVLSKKIGHPSNKEFAIGAVSLDSIITDKRMDVSNEYIEKETLRLKELLQKKHKLYRGNREPIDIAGKNVIVVDDGIATGNTLLVTLEMLRRKNPAKIIVAVPVLPYDTLKTFEENTDDFIYLIASRSFRGVGGFYENFDQVQDDEVMSMLRDTNPIN